MMHILWSCGGAIPISLPEAFRKALVHLSFLGFLFILNCAITTVNYSATNRGAFAGLNLIEASKFGETEKWEDGFKRVEDVRSYGILTGRI